MWECSTIHARGPKGILIAPKLERFPTHGSGPDGILIAPKSQGCQGTVVHCVFEQHSYMPKNSPNLTKETPTSA